MDKLRILRNVEQASLQHLGADEIRMYLLLLATSRENGEGIISYKSIRKAFGTYFHADRMLNVCRNLRKRGLIEAKFPPLDELAEQDFALNYRIVPAR